MKKKLRGGKKTAQHVNVKFSDFLDSVQVSVIFSLNIEDLLSFFPFSVVIKALLMRRKPSNLQNKVQSKLLEA